MPRHFVPIQLATDWLLIDAGCVREILGAEPWLPIPRARQELPGVVAWRGRAVPLIDLGRALGLDEVARTEARARTLIIQHERGVAALSADAAREVRAIDESALREVHSVAHRYAVSEVDTGGAVMPVVDLKALIDDLLRAAGRGSDAELA